MFSDIITNLIETFKNDNVYELNNFKFKIKNIPDFNNNPDIQLLFNMKLPQNLDTKKNRI